MTDSRKRNAEYDLSTVVIFGSDVKSDRIFMNNNPGPESRKKGVH